MNQPVMEVEVIDVKRRGPWLPQVEDVTGEATKKVDFLRKRWGYGGNSLSIADVIRRAIDEAYQREKQTKRSPIKGD